MQSTQSPQPVSPESIARGHEPSAIRLRGFFIFFAIFVGFGVVVMVVVWGMMLGIANIDKQGDAPVSPLAGGRSGPVQPWLQPSPAQRDANNVQTPRSEWQDLAQMRVDETKAMQSYKYDEKTGAVQIPIYRAMDILLERGVPTEKGATTQPIKAERSNPESSGGVR